MPRKIKIGTKVTHITRDSDITFKVKGHRGGAYCGGSRTACVKKRLIFVKCLAFREIPAMR